MMCKKWTFLWVLLLLLPAGISPGQEALDRYGGLEATHAAATGWFRTLRVNGRWWLVDPAGHLFLSAGVDCVSLAPDAAHGITQSIYREAALRKYGRPWAWAAAAVTRLRKWGFNTLGVRSDGITWRQGMPYTVLLNLSGALSAGGTETFPDVFAPSFRRDADQIAHRMCHPLANDPLLIGYFTDENLHWRPDQQRADTMLSQYLALDDYAPGRVTLLGFLSERYPSIQDLNRAWHTNYDSFDAIGRVPQVGASVPAAVVEGFLKLVAARYFTVTQAAVKAADPNHLLLGCRFSGGAPTAVLEVMRGRVDVVSVSGYEARPPLGALREIYQITQRPLLLTGFTSRARDSGLPNTKGRGPLLETQAARGAQYARYVHELMALPMVVGYHWYQHSDQPAQGSWGGENSNCGLVSLQDEPYAALVAAVTRANRGIYARVTAASAGRPSGARKASRASAR